ncbi:MAG: 23S rRNA (guanosine(2251)-2'-O)-methyltransferase RlmB [Nonlabens sp.]|uniref:23S rRNA (guanosine(2251)-2'-O)-methyltransferase RlmB n=1 Tax=Nonlabens sp. TaxID=1888209 RepID=UPI003EFAD4C7
MEKTTYIYGLRAIIEAIESGQNLGKVYLLREAEGVLMNQLKTLVNSKKITSSFVPAEKLDKISSYGNHQGAVASMSPVDFASLEEILEQRNVEEKEIYLLLDGVTDVRNFGAIIRTAECTGVSAIVISESGSAPINPATIKTSAGAVFNIPICKVSHIKDAVFLMKAYGITTIGATEKSSNLVYDVDLNRSVALIMGSEDRGINPSTLKVIDEPIKLPMKGEIASLNVSVACGAILYEIVRQQK